MKHILLALDTSPTTEYVFGRGSEDGHEVVFNVTKGDYARLEKASIPLQHVLGKNFVFNIVKEYEKPPDDVTDAVRFDKLYLSNHEIFILASIRKFMGESCKMVDNDILYLLNNVYNGFSVPCDATFVASTS